MAQKTYRTKPVEAWQLSAADFAAIVVWCTPDSSDAGTNSLVIGDTQAGLGDYVVKDIYGEFSILDSDEIELLYETEGTLATPDVVDLGSASYIPVASNVESQVNPDAAVTLSGGYFKAAVTTMDQPNLQIVGLLARASMAKNCIDAYGLQSHLTLGAAGESTGNMTAISGKTILGKSNAGGIVTAGLFTVEGSFTPNTGYGVWVDVVDASLTAGVEVHANGGTLAAGIKFDKTGAGALTKEIVMQNGETIDNAVNGLVNVTGNIGVNAVKVVGAQVAAIGLDAKADAAKITDIIAALRAHGLIGPNA